MPDTARYAIYLAPAAKSPLWQFGSSVLCYDAETGLDIPGFRLPSMPQDQWHKATSRARTYGFHATLKAPFRLADHQNEQALIEGLNSFAANQNSLPEKPLHLAVLDETGAGGFLALVPSEPYEALRILEAATVKNLDHFRAPLSKDEIAKRNPAALTKRQAQYLADYGYPYVLEEFRAHFTLSDRLLNAAALKTEINDLLIGHIGKASITVDELVLFKQPSADAKFKIMSRAPLGVKLK
jgi:2'-5' RNA ligase